MKTDGWENTTGGRGVHLCSAVGGPGGCSASKDDGKKVRTWNLRWSASRISPGVKADHRGQTERASPRKPAMTKTFISPFGYGEQATGGQHQRERAVPDGEFHCGGHRVKGAGEGGESGQATYPYIVIRTEYLKIRWYLQ